MATYHFIEKEASEKMIPPNRITVSYGKYQYDKFGTFLKAERYIDNKRDLILGNCEGSIMAIDPVRDTSTNPINKLHIGELMIRRPHAESYEEKGEKGVRVDLAMFDTHYAKQMLDELRRWRDPEYRDQLLKGYETCKWYCVPFRIEQLKISPKGLDAKIEELERHITALRSPEKRETRRLVYEKATQIEKASYSMVTLMNIETKALEVELQNKTRKERIQPKMIKNDDIWNLSESIQSNMTEVFNFICPKIDVKRARNYWNEISSWSKL